MSKKLLFWLRALFGKPNSTNRPLQRLDELSDNLTLEEEVALHVAGATVRHGHPFEALEVPRNADDVSPEFVEAWIMPYYQPTLTFLKMEDYVRYAAAAPRFTLPATTHLLGYFDWRPRITAAYFAAIHGYTELEEIIGNHLLKSEVCYAGEGYCLALAMFGTEKSRDYLRRYLSYYLTRPDLYFDQAEAFCALEHLDKNAAAAYLNDWAVFTSDKPNWNLDESRSRFAKSVQAVLTIRSLLNNKRV